MIRNCFRRCAVSALLLLVASLAGGSALATRALYPVFFWRAPPGATPEQSLVITAGAAYPDGGLAVAGYREGDPERYLYRIDPAGKTLWELKIEIGGQVIQAMARDTRDGLVLCAEENIIRRVDAMGNLDWRTETWQPPADETVSLFGQKTNFCDALIALPDGSTVAAGTLLRAVEVGTLRITRIDASGKLLWASDMPAPTPQGDGRVSKLVRLSDGDFEVLFDPLLPITNAHPPFLDSPAFWEWRISPDGQWRALNKMQQNLPLLGDWSELVAFYQLQDRLVRVGARGEQDDCGMRFEEWSLDGNNRIAHGHFPPLGKCDGWEDTASTQYPHSLALPQQLSAEYLATLDNDMPAAWYWLEPPAFLSHQYWFGGLQYVASLPRQRRVYLFGNPSEIYFVDLRAIKR